MGMELCKLAHLLLTTSAGACGTFSGELSANLQSLRQQDSKNSRM
jgi:hypothetical protein